MINFSQHSKMVDIDKLFQKLQLHTKQNSICKYFLNIFYKLHGKELSSLVNPHLYVFSASVIFEFMMGFTKLCLGSKFFIGTLKTLSFKFSLFPSNLCSSLIMNFCLAISKYNWFDLFCLECVGKTWLLSRFENYFVGV